MKKSFSEDAMHKVAGKLGTTPQTVQAALNNGDMSQLTANLKPEDVRTIQSVLSDEQKLKSLLESPMGKAFMKQFGK